MLSNNKTYENNNLRDVQKTFNDGVCDVYEAVERILVSYKGRFQFCNESVGIKHFYEAYANKIGVDMVISIPYNTLINTQDIVKINGDLFKVVQLTYKDNKKPFFWRISLEKVQFKYEDDTKRTT